MFPDSRLNISYNTVIASRLRNCKEFFLVLFWKLREVQDPQACPGNCLIFCSEQTNEQIILYTVYRWYHNLFYNRYHVCPSATVPHLRVLDIVSIRPVVLIVGGNWEQG